MLILQSKKQQFRRDSHRQLKFRLKNINFKKILDKKKDLVYELDWLNKLD